MPSPARTDLTIATGQVSVMAGRNPMSPRFGIGLSPYTAIPGRTMSKPKSGRVIVDGEFDR